MMRQRIVDDLALRYPKCSKRNRVPFPNHIHICKRINEKPNREIHSDLKYLVQKITHL